MRYLEEPSIAALEGDLARYFGTRYAVAVSSGTASLQLALLALGVRPGDEVLVPSVAVPMTAAAVLHAGAIPVFVDCVDSALGLDEASLEASLSTRTAGVIAVHLWGYSSHLAQLRAFADAHEVWLVEDACQAHGSKLAGKLLGTWGDAGCFSMHRSKLLSTGEGGFLLTNSDETCERASGMRTHWQVAGDCENSYARVGFNYRLSEAAAECARAQLPSLQERVLERQRRALQISTALCDAIPGARPLAGPDDEEPNGYSPVVLLPESAGGRPLLRHLARAGIPNSVGTFGLRSVWRWPAFGEFSRRDPTMTFNSDRLLERALAPALSFAKGPEDDAARIAEIARGCIASREAALYNL